jgi:hypothetical protein
MILGVVLSYFFHLSSQSKKTNLNVFNQRISILKNSNEHWKSLGKHSQITNPLKINCLNSEQRYLKTRKVFD